MSRSKNYLNIGYANIHMTYWMFYAVSNAFASAFLLSRGYTNAEIGIILAAASIIAIFLQPLMADISDRSKKISLIEVSQLSTFLLMILEASLFIFGHKSAALWTVFIMIVAWMTALQPLFNSMAFKLEESGVHINFGVCRSMGSLGYAVLCGILGILVERFGAGILPAAGELTLIALLITLFLVKKEFNKAVRKRNELEHLSSSACLENNANMPETTGLSEEKEEINIWRFIRDNRAFLILNMGVVGIFFSNAVLNAFMLQIVNGVGGTGSDMGIVLAVMAFLEMPPLIFFERIRKVFSCQTLLKVAAAGFVVKVGLIYIAKSMALIYFAHLFQTVGFGLFIPSMVAFTDEVMRKGEAVKGQALFTVMTTISSMVASVLGGIMLDAAGAKFMLLISTIVTACGAMIICFAAGKIRKKQRQSDPPNNE